MVKERNGDKDEDTAVREGAIIAENAKLMTQKQ